MIEDAVGALCLATIGRWKGCEWQTKYGRGGLNLLGLSSMQAELMARATSGFESADWKSAAQWLREVERDAQRASEEARAAAQAAITGDLREALGHIEQACLIESKYRAPKIWPATREAIQSILKNSESMVSTNAYSCD